MDTKSAPWLLNQFDVYLCKFLHENKDFDECDARLKIVNINLQCSCTCGKMFDMPVAINIQFSSTMAKIVFVNTPPQWIPCGLYVQKRLGI